MMVETRANDLKLAQSLFQEGNYTFVIVRDEQIVATGTRDGVGELLDAVTAHPTEVKGAALADKIVGKAVAMVAVYAGIASVYTPLGSQAAQEVLDEYGVSFQTQTLVPLIRNKRDDGPCPMEKLTLGLNDPAEAVNALRQFVAERRATVVTI